MVVDKFNTSKEYLVQIDPILFFKEFKESNSSLVSELTQKELHSSFRLGLSHLLPIPFIYIKIFQMDDKRTLVKVDLIICKWVLNFIFIAVPVLLLSLQEDYKLAILSGIAGYLLSTTMVLYYHKITKEKIKTMIKKGNVR